MSTITTSIRSGRTAFLFSIGLVLIPLPILAANECAVEFKAGSQTVTKNLSAGQTFAYSPVVAGLSWVRNKTLRPVDV